jgi:elongation factor 1-beta
VGRKFLDVASVEIFRLILNVNVDTKDLKMATAGVQFKIMPEGVDVDFDKIKADIEAKITSFESGVFNDIKEEPIAFGLKALIVTFALSEDEEVDNVENAVGEIEGVSSVEMIDYRRAVG